MKVFVGCLLVVTVLLCIAHNINANDEAMKVVCYYSQRIWYRKGDAKYPPNNIDPSLCTHIIYSKAVVNRDSLTIAVKDDDIDIFYKYYEQVTALREKGVKVLISIEDWIDPPPYRQVPALNDSIARIDFVNSVVEFLEKHNFDGLNVDLEYKTCCENTCKINRPTDKQDFGEMIKAFSEAFKPRGYVLSVALSSDQKIIDASYDLDLLSQYVDFMTLKTYDYHRCYNREACHHAALYSSDNYNADSTVNYFISNSNNHLQNKLILGVPTHGQSFTYNQNVSFGANSIGPGSVGGITLSQGTLGYFEVCDKVKAKGWLTFRNSNTNSGPFAQHDDQRVYYDDIENVRAKAKFVKEKKLGGVAISDLGYDDYMGYCGCGKSPLLTALNQELRGIGGTQFNTCT